jgi:hypothetical protein
VGNRALAEELADRVELCAVSKDELLISQGADEPDIYFILSGSFDVIVNGQKVAVRGLPNMWERWLRFMPTQRNWRASPQTWESAILKSFASSRKNLRAICRRETLFSDNNAGGH